MRVLDLSAYIAGPYGCTLLADQGAEVIKIEPPDGDNLRKYPSTLQAESRAFIGVNRSKLGIVLDLKTAAGLAALLRLVREADVLVHNFRPGVPKRLGIDYEQLSAINPRLIYCAVTGYGENGPMKDKAGYDQVLQTMTGMCALQGKRGGAPEIIYGSVVDYYAAALVAGGVASALYERERSGLGPVRRRVAAAQRVDDAVGALDLGRGRAARHRPRHALRRHHRHPSDARGLSLHLGEHAALLAERCARRSACRSWPPTSATTRVRKRAEHAAEIVPRLHEALHARSALEWEAHFGDDVPCAAARSLEDMFDNPQVLAEGHGHDHRASAGRALPRR